MFALMFWSTVGNSEERFEPLIIANELYPTKRGPPRKGEEGGERNKFTGGAGETAASECVIPCFINPLIATFEHVRATLRRVCYIYANVSAVTFPEVCEIEMIKMYSRVAHYCAHPSFRVLLSPFLSLLAPFYSLTRKERCCR